MKSIRKRVLFTLIAIFLINSSGIHIFFDKVYSQSSFDCSNITDVANNECEVITELYTLTDGDNWNTNTGWKEAIVDNNQDTTLCDWHGITCANGVISSISLETNNLSGTFPSEIQNLGNLDELLLTDNANLTGNISQSFADTFNADNIRLLNTQITVGSTYEYTKGDYIDFSQLGSWYYTDQWNSPSHEVLVEDNGDSIRMKRNSWKQLNLPIEIKENTVLEFEYEQINQGEVQGIGFDDINRKFISQVPERIFQLSGDAQYGVNEWGVHDYYQTSYSGKQQFRIPVGEYYTGSELQLVLVNDADTSALETAEIVFSKVKIFEEEAHCKIITDVSPNECNTVSTLFRHNEGSNWHINTGWKEAIVDNNQDTTLCDWHGITCANGTISSISLESNNLSGTIPTDIENLQSLQELLLTDNANLTGNISQSFADTFNADNIRLLNTQITVGNTYEYTKGDYIDFSQLGSWYYTDQWNSPSHEVLVEDNGDSIRMKRNSWKQLNLPIEVTANTVLEFEYEQINQGEVQGIGFDNINRKFISQVPERIFQLSGDAQYGVNEWGVHDYYQTNYSGKQQVRIPVGEYYTGSELQLILVNDADNAQLEHSEIIFSNVKIYDAFQNSSEITIDQLSQQGNVITINWTDTDSKEDSIISFYLDSDNQNADGMYLSHGIAESDVTNTVTFSVGDALDGEYYVYALVENTSSQPEISYSSNTITLTSPVPTGTVSGSTAGEFKVTDSGAATYEIPLTLSPGTSGLQPDLSLAFSSQAGNGLLGHGWSLQGLSTITRCAPTLGYDEDNDGTLEYGDGFIDGVDFDEHDRFCLDGQKLEVVSGTYGEDGAEYRTQSESFSKITSYKDVANTSYSPDYFVVETKAGLKMFYGNTADSKSTTLDETETSVWGVNRIEDTNGNYMAIHYEIQTDGNGNREVIEQRVKEIWYTGNISAGLDLYNKVEFIYEDRPDIQSGYFAEDKTQLSKRLMRIENTYYETPGNGTLVRSYDLAYGTTTNDPVQTSRLVSVTECGSDGTCFAPTTFEWSETVRRFENYSENNIIEGAWSFNTNGDFDGDWKQTFVDMNGDGLPDEVLAYAGADGTKTIVNLNTGDGLETYDGARTYWSHNENGDFRSWEIQMIDMNGDGLPDEVVSYHGNDGTKVSVNLNTGNGFENYDDANRDYWSYNEDGSYHLAGGEWKHTFIDMNADGLPDEVLSYTGTGGTQTIVNVNTGSGFENYDGARTYWSRNTDTSRDGTFRPFQMHMIDMNADGLPDEVIAYHGSSGVIVYVNLNTGDGFETYNGDRGEYWINNRSRQFVNKTGTWIHTFIDMNRDGLPDQILSYVGDRGTRTMVNLNTGGKFEDFVGESNYWSLNQNGNFQSSYMAMVDMNGDGLPDEVVVATPTIHDTLTLYKKRAIVNLNTGSGFENYDDPVRDYWSDYTSSKRNENFQPWYKNMIDMNGDGLPDEVIHSRGSGGSRVFLSMNMGNHTRLTKLTSGNGAETHIEYKPLTDTSVYTKGSGATYPDVDVQGAMYVVSSVAGSNGIGGTNTTEYSYEGLQSNRRGLGMLGFETVIKRNTTTGNKIVQTFNQTYPHIGSIVDSKEYVEVHGSDVLLKTSEFTYDVQINNINDKIVFPYIKESVVKQYELTSNCIDEHCSDGPLSSIQTYNVYGSHGNLTETIVHTYDGDVEDNGVLILSEKTVNEYADNEANWHLGRLTKATVEKSNTNELLPGVQIANTDNTKTSAFEYDASTGLLTKEIIEPCINENNCTTAELALRSEKNYVHDTYGNILTSTVNYVEDGIPKARTNTTTYDSKGRFIVTTTNDLNHTETQVHENLYGNVVSQTGPNGITTTWEYDSFGRALKEMRADGTYTETKHLLCDGAVGANCPTNAHYFVWTKSNGTAPSIIYYDILNREVRAEERLGRQILVDTVYNAKGLVEKESNPYFVGTTIYWTETIYDETGRAIQQINPDGTTISTMYEVDDFTDMQGRKRLYHKVAVTNQNGQVSWQLINPQGDTEVSMEINNTYGVYQVFVTSYQYDLFGNMVKVQLPQVNRGGAATFEIEMEYDKNGNRTKLKDPNLGTITYSFNALGEQTSRTDSNGLVSTTEYDTLGRVLTTTETAPNGATNYQSQTAVNTYDTGNKSIGKLSAVSDNNGYGTSHTYDNLGRTIQTVVAIDGTGYAVNTSYDEFGRIKTTKNAHGLVTEQVYDRYGRVQEVRNAETKQLYWRAVSRDALGNIVNAAYGNGVKHHTAIDQANGRTSQITAQTAGNEDILELNFGYDNVGNVTSRNEVRDTLTLTETFTYDKLNRMLKSQVGNGIEVEVEYDALGNITRRDIDKDGTKETYSYNALRAHAPTSVDGVSYTYDAQGNRTAGSDGQSIKYTSFNKPYEITSSDGNVMTFTYGPEANRYKSSENTASERIQTTYVGGIEIVLTDSDKNTNTGNAQGFETKKIKQYIGNYLVLTEIEDLSVSPITITEETEYILMDHLGSPTVITNEAGEIIERLSFDAWGERRDADDWVNDFDANNLSTLLLNRGFTGHEQLDSVGMIHMNGRVYDPHVGQFVSADPFVQESGESSQNYNRYSYVENNPLSATDPSGYFFSKIADFFKDNWKSIVTAVVTIAVAAVTGGAGIAFLGINGLGAPILVAGFAGGFAGGFVGTLLHGGSLGDAFSAGLQGGAIGAATAGLAYGVGEAFVSGSQGTMLANALKEAGKGFLTAGKAIAHGLASGVMSVVQGGKFAHGFIAGGLGTLAGAGIDDLQFQDTSSRVIADAIAGGTIAELSGGKFANGAVTGAFRRMFNDAMHPDEEIKAGVGTWKKGPTLNNIDADHQGMYPDTNGAYIHHKFSVGATIAGELGCACSDGTLFTSNVALPINIDRIYVTKPAALSVMPKLYKFIPHILGAPEAIDNAMHLLTYGQSYVSGAGVAMCAGLCNGMQPNSSSVQNAINQKLNDKYHFFEGGT